MENKLFYTVDFCTTTDQRSVKFQKDNSPVTVRSLICVVKPLLEKV